MTEPWSRRAVLRAVVAVGVAAVLLVVAWVGASDTTQVDTQLRWLNLGLVGILLVGAATAVTTLDGRRAVGIRRQQLLPDEPKTAAATDVLSNGTEPIVSVARMRRYHRTSCPLVAGKPAQAAEVAVHRQAGLEPCGICEPGPPAVEAGH
ncbi:MAG: hypothetical protein ACRD0O_08215 [Acidimicrobiia bacterium]